MDTLTNSKYRMDKIKKVLEKGWDIKIYVAPRRLTLRGCRDFYARYLWNAELNEKTKKESKWEGFETPLQCLNNMYKELL